MLQRKKITKNIEDTSKKKLSIQFSLDGFSFCISNSKNEIYEFSSFLFDEKVNSPEILLQHIEGFFREETILQDDFEFVLIIHKNNLNSFVPNEYFKEENLKDYLKFSVKTLNTDLIAYDNLDENQIKNVYVPYVNINNFLFQNFGEFEYKHHSSVLVQKLLNISIDEESYFYVNIHKTTFDVVVIENQKLALYNSFEYNTKEDFIYYILFTMEQLKYNPDKNLVILLGEIDEFSELYKITYNYIRNISFLEVTNHPFPQQTEIENHSNFILLG